MNAQTINFMRMPLPARGAAAIVLIGIAIAVFAISSQLFQGVVAPAEAVEAAAEKDSAAPAARSSYRCADCGVIESMREVNAGHEETAIDSAGRHARIETHPLASYEITIRLQDGSMRVIRDASPANWRHGEPVTIIAGVD